MIRVVSSKESGAGRKNERLKRAERRKRRWALAPCCGAKAGTGIRGSVERKKELRLLEGRKVRKSEFCERKEEKKRKRKRKEKEEGKKERKKEKKEMKKTEEGKKKEKNKKERKERKKGRKEGRKEG
jgi:hypothetical protein